eukprot:g11896.t1
MVSWFWPRIPFQTTINACGGSTRAALRIARACYVKLADGESKEEVKRFRDQCYARLNLKKGNEKKQDR